jgi:hypothetical protein
MTIFSALGFVSGKLRLMTDETYRVYSIWDIWLERGNHAGRD